jgi:hypothetical protein
LIEEGVGRDPMGATDTPVITKGWARTKAANAAPLVELDEAEKQNCEDESTGEELNEAQLPTRPALPNDWRMLSDAIIAEQLSLADTSEASKVKKVIEVMSERIKRRK